MLALAQLSFKKNLPPGEKRDPTADSVLVANKGMVLTASNKMSAWIGPFDWVKKTYGEKIFNALRAVLPDDFPNPDQMSIETVIQTAKGSVKELHKAGQIGKPGTGGAWVPSLAKKGFNLNIKYVRGEFTAHLEPLTSPSP